MNCLRKLLVVNTSRRPDLPIPKKWNDSLPFLEGIQVGDQGLGLIRNVDGGLGCVVKVSGHGLTFLESEHLLIASTFENVLSCIDSSSALQFLIVSKPFDPDAFVDAYRERGPKDSPYLDWYSDYTSKWFRRICEHSVVPRKEFFIVVTERGSTNQRKQLSRRLANVISVLEQGGLNAQALKRAEVRQLIYSCMRLSYSSGLTQQPVETLSNSSLPNVGGKKAKNHLIVDGQFVASHVLSDLPSKAKVGWLMNLVVVGVQSTFSLHVRKVNPRSVRKPQSNDAKRIVRSSGDFYELSMYASTFADSAEKLEVHRDGLKKLFKREGALLTPDSDQFSAWISTLPLGIDSGGVTHLVPADTAQVCWPFFTEQCGSTLGFPLGFARSSREPVFLSPTEMSNVSVLASTKRDLRYFHSLLTVRMLTSDCHVLYIDNGQNEMSTLLDVLGPNLVNNWRSIFDKPMSHDPEDAEKASPSLTLLSMCASSKQELKRFQDAVGCWHKIHKNMKSLTIVISEVNQFENATYTTETLLYLFQFAKQNNINIIIGGLTSGTGISSQISAVLREHADIKMVLPMTQKGQAQAAKIFSLSPDETRIVSSFSRDERIDRHINCFLRTNENRGVVRITPSPMDYWLCTPSGFDVDKKFRKMKIELKAKNPKLSETDVARQAVYYLGLQAPEQ